MSDSGSKGKTAGGEEGGRRNKADDEGAESSKRDCAGHRFGLGHRRGGFGWSGAGSD